MIEQKEVNVTKKYFYELSVSHVTLTAKYLSRAFSVVAEFYLAPIFQVFFENGLKLWLLIRELLWQ